MSDGPVIIESYFIAANSGTHLARLVKVWEDQAPSALIIAVASPLLD